MLLIDVRTDPDENDIISSNMSYLPLQNIFLTKNKYIYFDSESKPFLSWIYLTIYFIRKIIIAQECVKEFFWHINCHLSCVF